MPALTRDSAVKVSHVMVVGHYGCSGVRAAMERRRVGLADNWLRHVQDVHIKHAQLLPETMDSNQRHDRLCELNVIEQVVNVCQSTVMRDTWRRRQDLTVHGWIYGLRDGLVRDLGATVAIRIPHPAMNRLDRRAIQLAPPGETAAGFLEYLFVTAV